MNSSSLSVLDIGTGSGSFLRSIETEFENCKVYGIEYDPRLVTVTNQKIKCGECRQGNAEDFEVPKEKMDIVTSFHVIEHLYKPEKLLRQANKCLKMNGILILATPNLDSIARHVHGKSWQGFRFDHVSLKNRDDWTSEVIKNGFSPLFVGTTFFSGIKAFKIPPLNLITGLFSFLFGAVNWKYGESVIGAYRKVSEIE